MDRLFVYGTLIFPQLREAVVGRALPGEPGTLRGHARRRVRGATYPAAIACEGSSVEGVVVAPVDERALRALDRFEGALYERVRLGVELAHGEEILAWVYVVPPSRADAVSNEAWSPEAFEASHLEPWLAAEGPASSREG